MLKDNLARLPLAVERELRDFEERAARKHAEDLYSNLVERVPVGLFRTLPGGAIAESNPALIEMLGFSDADSLKAANVSDLWVCGQRSSPEFGKSSEETVWSRTLTWRCGAPMEKFSGANRARAPSMIPQERSRITKGSWWTSPAANAPRKRPIARAIE